ncbi:putative protein kinase RLK-Pelle-DLSV family [Helianthus annuus]|nr:putative protein kinase RLK-Pelle-DLSV family [Helianthus annuus]
MAALYNLVLFCVLFSILATCTVQDTITVDQVIRDGDTLVSASEIYELGFFSPGRSTNRFMGIWYKNISPQTVVWVANRETPITDLSGVFRVATNGSLLVIAGSNKTTVWSSETPTTINPVAQLLDSGNLVVRRNGEESFIWQSFDYPGDTFLPGMKLGKDLVSGLDRRWRPWKSLDDPSPGEFEGLMDTNGFPQVFVDHGSVPLTRSGPWNGNTFSGNPSHSPSSPINLKFVFDDKEVYFMFTIANNSLLSRAYMNPEGYFLHMIWVDRSHQWFTYWQQYINICTRFGLCGPNGWCNPDNSPSCSCMEGFEPRQPADWSASDWSSGCQRRTPLECPKGDGFRVFKNIKLPDTRRSWYNRSMTLDECMSTCKSNCSCIAYANIEITRGGSGCLLWFDDLVDVRTVEEGQDLYVRMSQSDITINESTSKPSYNKKRGIIIAAVSISSCLVTIILILVIVYAWNKKKTPDERIKIVDEEYNKQSQHDDDMELSYFSLVEISMSTKDFSNDKKLGQGGFGPVYKGVLDDGREIAVKKLSKTSRQGVNEFRNELKFIAKLQHRNLVKLLGYCNEGDESMLIYEYMPNKSLDLFIFDKIRSLTLDWSNRFHIINGIIRGLLYLHHDSRFKIVHRDLKASNILLDVDMNPKISDFGLARMFRDQENEANTNRVVGTLGYIAPEYAIDGTYSEKSDVFSFGVLVLEIVSRKTNRGFSRQMDDDNLLAHAWRLYEEGKALELLGAYMRDSCVDSQVLRSIHIGLLCVQHHAKDRPTMLSVALMFDQDCALPAPKQPAFFSEGTIPNVNQISISGVTMTTLEPR